MFKNPSVLRFSQQDSQTENVIQPLSLAHDAFLKQTSPRNNNNLELLNRQEIGTGREQDNINGMDSNRALIGSAATAMTFDDDKGFS